MLDQNPLYSALFVSFGSALFGNLCYRIGSLNDTNIETMAVLPALSSVIGIVFASIAYKLSKSQPKRHWRIIALCSLIQNLAIPTLIVVAIVGFVLHRI